MLQYCIDALQQVAFQPVGLVFALALGFVSAITSACCTLPALGLLAGYSGSQTDEDRKIAIRKVLLFTIGIVVSLIIIGGVAGFVGQVAQSNLGRYWKIFAGLVAVFLGIAALKLLPFQLSVGRFERIRTRLGTSGAILAGLLLGGIIAATSLPCNPGIFIVVGAAILKGKVVWAGLMLAMFAVGFSIPLGAVLLGVSVGKASFASKGADTAIRWVAGLILVSAGFYFLVTF